MIGYRGNQIDSNVNLNLNNQYLFQLNNCQSQLYHQPVKPRKPVGIFWDIENCSIPRGLNSYSLVSKIRTFFEQFSLVEREFVVVCDVYGINNSVINELNDMQIDIVHVCSYSKNASDEKLKQLIYRFVMIHGQHCAIILLTSDINFAPLLSDIKNRIGISVILFHHRQVSPALVACSHHNIDFDYFCSQIPISLNYSIESDCSITYLNISNWPRYFNEENARSYLNRITSNSGGRVIQIDYRICDATVAFKCKSDAQRCLQRVNNRRIHGNTLKAKIAMNTLALPQIRPNNYYNYIPNSIQPMPKSTNLPQISSSQEDLQNQNRMASFLNKLKANHCELCTRDCERLSTHSNYLFKREILSVHISLENLSEKIQQLLEQHSGKLPLNSVPHCWLIAFGQEMDTRTEPKVMLEHLVTCLEGVVIEIMDVTINGETISTKFVVKSQKNQNNKSGKRKKRRLKTVSSRIFSLIISNTSKSLTSFPSILLSNLPLKYEQTFKERLSIEQFGVSSLVELMSLFHNKYNLYTFDDDYLVALNFKEHIKCFLKDIREAFSLSQIAFDSDVDIDELKEIFKCSFKTDLKMSVYGVCFIEDIINAVYKPNCTNGTIIDSSHEQPTAIDEINLNKCIPFVQELLKSQPNWSIHMKDLYHQYFPFLQSKLRIPPCSYLQFSQYFRHSKLFQIISGGKNDWILLSTKLRQIDLTKRLLKVYYLLCFVDHQHPTDCECSISFPINYIFTHYLLRYNVEFFESELYGTSSLLKVFERALACMYRTQMDDNFCLIYTANNIYLQRCDLRWMEEQVLNVFFILFKSTSYSMTLREMNQTYKKKFSYSLGLSSFRHKRFREFVCVYEKEGVYFIKLCPIYEFAAMCLTVMILHSNASKSLETKTLENWSITRLETEYYDHFGIEMPKPSCFEITDFKCVFEQISCLFDVNKLSSRLEICFKRLDLLGHINHKSIPTCNYCEIKILEDMKAQSGISQNFCETLLSANESESDNEKESFYELLHL